MKYKYFVSGRWRNRDEVRKLAKSIRDKNHTAYCMFDAGHSDHRLNEDPEVSMQKFESIPNWQENSYVKRVFENDMTGLKESEIFVMLLPAGKSCHTEAGVAYGLGKKLILIGEQKETESLYLIFNETYPTIEAFIAAI
jgi:hypothetical protein